MGGRGQVVGSWVGLKNLGFKTTLPEPLICLKNCVGVCRISYFWFLLFHSKWFFFGKSWSCVGISSSKNSFHFKLVINTIKTNMRRKPSNLRKFASDFLQVHSIRSYLSKSIKNNFASIIKIGAVIVYFPIHAREPSDNTTEIKLRRKPSNLGKSASEFLQLHSISVVFTKSKKKN